MLSSDDQRNVENSEELLTNKKSDTLKLYRFYKSAVQDLFKDWAFIELVFEYYPQTIRTTKMFGFKKENHYDLTNVERFCVEIVPGSYVESVFEFSFDDTVNFLENMCQYSKIELTFLTNNIVKTIFYLSEDDTGLSVKTHNYDLVVVKFMS